MAVTAVQVQAQKKNSKIDVAEALKGYFKPVTTPSATPDAEGFIRRWMILEPISSPIPRTGFLRTPIPVRISAWSTFLTS